MVTIQWSGCQTGFSTEGRKAAKREMGCFFNLEAGYLCYRRTLLFNSVNRICVVVPGPVFFWRTNDEKTFFNGMRHTGDNADTCAARRGAEKR
jgi:hypothetical protein